MTDLEILKKVRKLIEIPQRWTRHAWSRNNKGQDVGRGYKKEACRWCLDGAFRYISSINNNYYIDGAKYKLNTTSVISFNDEHSHKDVIKLLDDAINKPETE